MTKNAARKRTIRALAEAEGISYTTALRKYGAETDENGNERRPHLPLHLHGHSVMAFLAVDGLWHGDREAVTDNHDLTNRQWNAFCDPEGVEAPLSPVLRTARAVIGDGLNLCPNCFGSVSDRRADAQLPFLGQILGDDAAIDPLPAQAWALQFRMREDLSLPYDLEVTTGGLVSHQSFWRGEKFQIIGFTDSRAAGRIHHTWRETEQDPSLAVGRYPVISTLDGSWATWSEKVAEINTTTYEPRGLQVTATVQMSGEEPVSARFRCEEFLAALTDADLGLLESSGWVADDRISGLMLRAAIARGDAGAQRVGTAAEAIYETDPEAWDDAEPFTVSFDPDEATRWRERTRLYPSRR